MKARGRHDFWEKGLYEIIKNKNEPMLARCMICSRVLRNTARSRLITHRNVCPKVKKTGRRRRKRTVQSASDSDTPKDESVVEPKKDVEMENISNIVNMDTEVIKTEDLSAEGSEYESIREFLDNHSGEICLPPQIKQEKPEIEALFTSNSTAYEPERIKLPQTSFIPSPSPGGACSLEDIHLAFTEFFISSNISFKTLESFYLKRLLTKLNRHYNPPTLEELLTTYVDKIHEKYEGQIPCKEQDAVLLLSGWKDFSDTSKCLVGCLYLKSQNESQDKRVFLNTWDLDIDFTGEEIESQTKIIQESHKLAKEFYNANIFAVISDNLELEIGSVPISASVPLWHSVCHSFLAGCLIEDIIDPDDVKFVKQILQAIKSKGIEAKLLESGGSRITLPSEKQYCTYRDSFRCLLTNNCIIQDLLGKKNVDFNDSGNCAIPNQNFFKKIENYLNVIEPLCELIYLSQERNATLAEITEKWMELPCSPEFQEHLEKRRAQALTPLALTANFMHPSYRGRRFNNVQMETVEYFLLEILDSPGLDQLLLFKRNEDIFKVLATKQITSYDTFWTMAERKCHELATLAKRLLWIPPSVSYVDKIFSNWSAPHSQTRNILGMDLYRRLTRAHFELNLADNTDS
ncbi:unnamed protein product [Hermetia illucens]|uniref:HAT C-terminal dimerisation domain-containing protein n=1 Tax=Hermetia illucens TaxID=343691 RepID=A0A7R8Z0G5_HERIL|nr:uncharacterized protein LOC119660222 [Hermetia illucens]CAD7092374.1 unnamed protein product [Hermetia illucens]